MSNFLISFINYPHVGSREFLRIFGTCSSFRMTKIVLHEYFGSEAKKDELAILMDHDTTTGAQQLNFGYSPISKS